MHFSGIRVHGNGLLTFRMQETAHRLTTESYKRERYTTASVYRRLVMHEQGNKVQRRAGDHDLSPGRTNDVDAVLFEPLHVT